MFETYLFNPAISILNEFLKKKYLQYYSIQVSTVEKEKKIFILNFEEIKKKNILLFFNFISEELKKTEATFLENVLLEKEFLKLIPMNGESNINLTQYCESVVFNTTNESFLLDFYSINIDQLDENDSFIYNFLKISNNFKRKGFLIINFVVDNNDEIKFCLQFIEISSKKEESFSTEQNINKFFNKTILKRYPMKIKDIYTPLWRKNITDNYISFKSFQALFLAENHYDSQDLHKFNEKFKRKLDENQIESIKLSKNLLLIEQTFLVLMLPKLKSDYIQNVIKHYISDYFIYVSILDAEDCERLLNIEQFKSLKNIHVLNSKEILNLDLNLFKS
ncbi:MAG: hypothetical protein ACW986_02450 [Promethearchaeota archaeon]